MKKKNKQSVRDLGNTIKCTNICIMGIMEGEKRNQQEEYMNKRPKTFQI